MDPVKPNYEILFSAWLEGTLSDEKCGQLMKYLDENPDFLEKMDSLNSLKLTPGSYTFSRAEELKRSPDDFSVSQINYLSVAFLEKDLDQEHASELLAGIENDSVKKREFEIIQKMKLLPAIVKFGRKKKLVRRTPAEKIFRLSLTVLSSAAAATLLFLAYYFYPHIDPDSSRLRYVSTGDDSLEILYPARIKSKAIPEQSNLTKLLAGENGRIQIVTKPSAIDQFPDVPEPENNILAQESGAGNSILIARAKVPDYSKILVAGKNEDKTLIEINDRGVYIPVPDGRSNVEKFMARVFHEKIMNDKTRGDRPIKPFEVAEAGVAGLNKLLGWEMALLKNTDDKGVTKSVSFSSKMLNFNAPVKKGEPPL